MAEENPRARGARLFGAAAAITFTIQHKAFVLVHLQEAVAISHELREAMVDKGRVSSSTENAGRGVYRVVR